jgi:hypothetical protein
MNIKILMLKSLEDIIADVSYRQESSEVIVKNPFILTMNSEKSEVGFYPYAPLSSDVEISIPMDWIVSIVNPLKEIANSYEEKINAKSEVTSSEN